MLFGFFFFVGIRGRVSLDGLPCLWNLLFVISVSKVCSLLAMPAGLDLLPPR